MFQRYLYVTWLRRRLAQFMANARRSREMQERSLMCKIARHANSDFGRDFGFSSMRTPADFRQQMPVLKYEDYQPYIDRVLRGDNLAMFAPGTRVLMFAMTSGTTGQPKRLPITKEFLREYKIGWRLWGGGVYGDHGDLIRKKTLQLTSDWQQEFAPSGVPCGQISGLAASTKPRVARPIFMPPHCVSRVHHSAAKHYATLRLALATDKIGIIITANPSTLVEVARRADSERESLIRDIHDGTLSCSIAPEVRRELAPWIRKRQPARARQLEQIVAKHDALWLRFAWPNVSVLAVWTGGSSNVYLPQLQRYYGPTAIRDHGLSASEGRMTIPLNDGTAAGVLDFYHHYFEFIPEEEHDTPNPTVLEAHELEVGQNYYILLTTSAGLYRYDIHDVVRCTGYEGQAPVLEFLNKGKNFSSITGEKLSEYQAIQAVRQSFQEMHLPMEAFTLAPQVVEKPRYLLLLEPRAHQNRAEELAQRVQANLERVNEEYGEKSFSGRLLPIQVREVPAGTWNALRHERTSQRGNFEEFKHPCLVGDLDFVNHLAGLSSCSIQTPAGVS